MSAVLKPLKCLIDGAHMREATATRYYVGKSALQPVKSFSSHEVLSIASRNRSSSWLSVLYLRSHGFSPTSGEKYFPKAASCVERWVARGA